MRLPSLEFLRVANTRTATANATATTAGGVENEDRRGRLRPYNKSTYPRPELGNSWSMSNKFNDKMVHKQQAGQRGGLYSGQQAERQGVRQVPWTGRRACQRISPRYRQWVQHGQQAERRGYTSRLSLGYHRINIGRPILFCSPILTTYYHAQPRTSTVPTKEK